MTNNDLNKTKKIIEDNPSYDKKYFLTKIKCECGVSTARCNMSKHRKTEKHIKWEKNGKSQCECGDIVEHCEMRKHKKSKGHLIWLHDKPKPLPTRKEIYELMGLLSINKLRAYIKDRESKMNNGI